MGVGLGLAAVAWGQSTAGAELPASLRAHLQDERFEIVTSIRGLPLGVREELQKLFGNRTLDIAEPGAEFQKQGAAVDPQLPSRRLVAAGCSPDHHCLLYYERGGTALSWHVMLFHWTPAATQFQWGGSGPDGFATIDEVRKAILSGAIKGHAGAW